VTARSYNVRRKKRAPESNNSKYRVSMSLYGATKVAAESLEKLTV
jgi:hypothetical protein